MKKLISDHSQPFDSFSYDSDDAAGPNTPMSLAHVPSSWEFDVSMLHPAGAHPQPGAVLYSSDLNTASVHEPEVVMAAGAHSNQTGGSQLTSSGSTLVASGSSTGLTINLTWDSSVSSAPTGFTSTVLAVAQY